MSNQPAFQTRPVPVQAGIGLRPPHFRRVLAEHPCVPWFEVHSENFFCAGGELPHVLEAVRRSGTLYFRDYSSDSGNLQHYGAAFPAVLLETA